MVQVSQAALRRVASAARRYWEASQRLEGRAFDWRYLLDDPLHEEVARARQGLFAELERLYGRPSPPLPGRTGEQLALFLPRRRRAGPAPESRAAKCQPARKP